VDQTDSTIPEQIPLDEEVDTVNMDTRTIQQMQMLNQANFNRK